MNKHIRARRLEDREIRDSDKKCRRPVHQLWELIYGNKNPKYHHRWNQINGLIRKQTRATIKELMELRERYPEEFQYYLEHKDEFEEEDDD